MKKLKKIAIVLLFCCLNLLNINTVHASDIIIDAGHGGKDNGATYQLNGKTYHEKDLTLAISRQLQRALKQRGRTATLTRTRDRYISPTTRLTLSRRKCKKLFISIHVDAHHNPKIHGATVYIAPRSTAKTQTLARAMQNSLNPKRKPRQAHFIVLRNPKCPSILVEVGYMSNEQELKQLIKRYNRYQIAQKMAKTIDQYLEKPKNIQLASHISSPNTAKIQQNKSIA